MELEQKSSTPDGLPQGAVIIEKRRFWNKKPASTGSRKWYLTALLTLGGFEVVLGLILGFACWKLYSVGLEQLASGYVLAAVSYIAVGFLCFDKYRGVKEYDRLDAAALQAVAIGKQALDRLRVVNEQYELLQAHTADVSSALNEAKAALQKASNKPQKPVKAYKKVRA